MKKWKKITGIVLVILFAYIYACVADTDIKGFDVETFCMFLLVVIYIVSFFKILIKLFSR